MANVKSNKPKKSKKRILIILIVLIAIGVGVFQIYINKYDYAMSPIIDPATEVIIDHRTNIELQNPYEDVNWELYEQHKGNLHTHSWKSDGYYSPGMVIDAYKRKGYTILAFADHNHVTYPWEDYRRDPEELGMLAIQANELSDYHHIGSYFSDFNIGRKHYPVLGGVGKISEDHGEHAVMEGIGEKGGLAVFFHPGRYDYPAEFYADFYRTYDFLIGMEVINQGDRYTLDREMWDEVLTMLMPERPVWGFSNDDMHIMGHMKHCFNMFLLPELSEHEFRNAMEKGQFYFSHGEEAPVIESINIDNEAGIAEIDADGWEEIVWISEGRVILHGSTLSFRDTPNIGSYVRAELISEQGATYTNPFGVIE